MVVFEGIFFRKGNKGNSEYYTDHFKKLNKQNSTYEDDDVFFSASSASSFVSPVLEKGCYVLVGDITLYNSRELKSTLGLATNETTGIVLAAYEKWGDDCARYLSGDYCFAIFDKQTRSVFCARDHIGHRPFYYYTGNNVFIFSNRLYSFSSFDFARKTDSSWFVDFLQNSYNNERSDTVYECVKRLLPAHALIIKSGSSELKKYWDLSQLAQQENIKATDAIEQLRWHLDDAVKMRVDTGANNAVELSGGLDSSVVALYAQKYLDGMGEALTLFSNILPAQYKDRFAGYADEWSKSGIVAAHLNIAKHYGVDDTGLSPIDMLERGIDAMGYPTWALMSLHQTGIYDAAQRNGVTNLLSGFGGDQMVTAYARGRYINTLIKEGRWISAFDMVYKQDRSLYRTGAYLGYSIANSIFDLKNKGTQRTLDTIRKKSILRDEWLADERTKERLYGNAIFMQGPVRKKSIDDLSGSALLERLESGSILTAGRNIRYGYPLLHVPLLEYFYTLPDRLKADHKHGRALIRAVMRGLLPPSIVEQPKVAATATGTTPFVKVLVKNNFTMLKDRCLSFSTSDEVFTFADRAKVEALQYNPDSFSAYGSLLSLMALKMFMDRQKQH